MKVILMNGVEVTPIMVVGESRYVHGVSRDALSFIFPASEDMKNLDSVFSAENCESVTIVGDEGGSYIHSGYTIRAELSKTSVEVVPATEDAEAVYEDRITVCMAQRTYSESQLASLIETVDLLVMESLMG